MNSHRTVGQEWLIVFMIAVPVQRRRQDIHVIFKGYLQHSKRCSRYLGIALMPYVGHEAVLHTMFISNLSLPQQEIQLKESLK